MATKMYEENISIVGTEGDSGSNEISIVGGGDTASKLPSEIWVKILSQVHQKDLVRFRMVCSTWRNVIDEHFQFSTIVHDDKTNLDRVYELKIKDCLVTKLIQDEEILQFPDLLRRVRFWGPINIFTLQRILQNAINLEELSMTRCPLAQKRIFHKQNVFTLKKLKKLELLGYCCKNASEEVSTNVISLLSHEMPQLSKVFININCNWNEMDCILAAFFDFLALHRKRIKFVNSSLIPAAIGHERISHLPTPISQSTKSLLYDQEFQLESLRLTAATKYISCWAPIIQNQTKLKDLRVHWICSGEPPNPNLTGISCSVLYPAIIQSALTLVFLDLREVNLTIDDRRSAIPFDASVFKCSQNLRRLVLVRNKDDVQRTTEAYGTATLINLDAVLPVLEDLEIVRFKCRSAELQILVDSSPLLKTVKLHHTGSSWGSGVHGGIVESIAKKVGIKQLNICPVNQYHDTEENKKFDILKLRYQGICLNGMDHLYYDFDRFRQGISQPNSYNYPPIIPVVPSKTSLLDRGKRFVVLQSSSSSCATAHLHFSSNLRQPGSRSSRPLQRFEKISISRSLSASSSGIGESKTFNYYKNNNKSLRPRYLRSQSCSDADQPNMIIF